MARILIIDDDKFYLDFLRSILEPDGYDIVEAGNGKSGLSKFKAGQKFEIFPFEAEL